MKQVFVSYRREDSADATRALSEQLRMLFGVSSVFMDRNRISPGTKWPQRLQRALEEATLLLAVIGPRWLHAADTFGRRRLDKKDDWVRLELETAIERGMTIIPVLVNGGVLPPDEALPRSLRPLLEYQCHLLSDGVWNRQLRHLVELLTDQHGFVLNQKPIWYPEPRVDVPELDQQELEGELRTLSGWEPVESEIPGDYPKSRIELRKVFVFENFPQAIRFMSEAVDFIEAKNPYPHHPRWENLWRTVTVWLSTWDIGHRISHLDVKLARELDRTYRRITK